MNFRELIPASAPRDEWLAARRRGVASTDAPRIAGVSPWGTALDVFAEKKRLVGDRQPTPEMEWGKRLEPIVATAYADATGARIEWPPALVQNVDTPWLLASLDCLTTDGRIVELKTARTAKDWGEPGTDEVPETYLVQVQHQLLVTGATAADVAVLIGGSDFRIYTVERHDRLLESLYAIEESFWNNLQAGIAPAPDWQHPRTADLMREIHRGCDGEIDLGDDCRQLAIDFTIAKLRAKEFSDQADTLKSKLLAVMGNAAIARLPRGIELCRKVIHRREYVVKAGDYVRFTVKGLNNGESEQ